LNAEHAETNDFFDEKMHFSAGFAVSRLRSTRSFSSYGEARQNASGAKAAALIVIWW
jgi:hypothetical protein